MNTRELGYLMMAGFISKVIAEPVSYSHRCSDNPKKSHDKKQTKKPIIKGEFTRRRKLMLDEVAKYMENNLTSQQVYDIMYQDSKLDYQGKTLCYSTFRALFTKIRKEMA